MKVVKGRDGLGQAVQVAVVNNGTSQIDLLFEVASSLSNTVAEGMSYQDLIIPVGYDGRVLIDNITMYFAIRRDKPKKVNKT